MNRDALQPPPVARCPHCQSSSPPGATKCWLCGRTIIVMAEAVSPQAPPPLDALVIGHPPSGNPYASPLASEADALPTFRLVDVLLLFTSLCVILGLFRIAPGAAVLVGAILLPVFVRTVLVLRVRQERQLHTTGRDRALFVVGSLLTTVGLYLTATVAASVTAFASLLLACSGILVSNGRGTERLFSIAMFAIGVPLTIGYLVSAVAVIRRRWNRDTQQ